MNSIKTATTVVVTLLVLIIIVVTIGVLLEETHTVGDIDDVYKFAGKRIETTITAQTELNDTTELEYFIPIPISTGKTTTFTFIPIFDKYRVFTTDTNVHLAFDGDVPKTGVPINVIGRVEDDKTGTKFFIKVSEWSY